MGGAPARRRSNFRVRIRLPGPAHVDVQRRPASARFIGVMRRQSDPLSTLRPRQRASQMRQRCPQVGEKRRVGTRAPDVAQVERRDQQRLLPLWPAHAKVAMGTEQRRASCKDLSPFASHQVGQRDEDAMLLGNLANQSLPASDRRRTGVPVVTWMNPARRCS